MTEKVYLHLLILCGIWSQGIIGIFANEEIKQSSDFLVRQRRVINLIPGEDKAIEVKTVPYIVHIKLDMRIHCVGSILSHSVVITSALCVPAAASMYHVVSASSRTNRGTLHIVTDIRRHYGNNSNRPLDGIALLSIHEPILNGAYTKYIKLHSEPLLPGIRGTVSGWGFDCGFGDRGTNHPTRLRSIQVPILAHSDCVNRYRPHINISDKDICTYDSHKRCGHNDGGAPLVVDGYLAGVYLWTGVRSQRDQISYPDVFVMLQHSEYNQWIRTNVENIDSQS